MDEQYHSGLLNTTFIYGENDQRQIPDLVANIFVDSTDNGIYQPSNYSQQENPIMRYSGNVGARGAQQIGPKYTMKQQQRFKPYFSNNIGYATNLNNLNNSRYQTYNGQQQHQSNQLSKEKMTPISQKQEEQVKQPSYAQALSGTSVEKSKINSNLLTKYLFNLGNLSECGDQTVTLLISNLDSSMDESNLRSYLLTQLKSITPIISLTFDSPSVAKVKVANRQAAKFVVSHMHRKRVGHKRMVVSYSRESSSAEMATLRCQVAGLLLDIPNYSLPLYKFRELFQSRFKTSISVLDLYKMQDICNITIDKNTDKFISLQEELITLLQSNAVVDSFHSSVPYCTIHFKREKYKGWAEQEMEVLPNVVMTIAEIESLIYPLLKTHHGDIPIASLIYCIEGQLNVDIVQNDNGVNLEHLVQCVHGVQIATNNFGIKIVTWLDTENNLNNTTRDIGDGAGSDLSLSRYYSKGGNTDPMHQISREIIELIKLTPKATLKFNRFIPAYHNHFGKQCRVADYGYTRLIELFESLKSVVQVMGDGENRQVTLTHRTQIRRFTTDLLRILRNQANKSILLSQLPDIFSQTQNRPFNVTDYGVCDLNDILEGLVNSNAVVISNFNNSNDVLITIPKRKQTTTEIEKICVFAGELVEMFRNAPQYSILFQKFVRSYHYHFGYQCRLSDYGFSKLADLMEAVHGVVEMEATNDEDRKIYLSPKLAIRVFGEQLHELIKCITGISGAMIQLNEVLKAHKNKFGYQIQPQIFDLENILDVIQSIPYIELLEVNNCYWIISHIEDAAFRYKTYSSCKIIIDSGANTMLLSEFLHTYHQQFNEDLSERLFLAMKYAIIPQLRDGLEMITLTPLMSFIINIITILKTKKSISMTDLKSTMNLSITSCFQYGFPNISSLVNAFPDIFISPTSTTIHERSDFELNPKCILIPNNDKKLDKTQTLSSDHSSFNFGNLKSGLLSTQTQQIPIIQATTSRVPFSSFSKNNQPAALNNNNNNNNIFLNNNNMSQHFYNNNNYKYNIQKSSINNTNSNNNMEKGAIPKLPAYGFQYNKENEYSGGGIHQHRKTTGSSLNYCNYQKELHQNIKIYERRNIPGGISAISNNNDLQSTSDYPYESHSMLLSSLYEPPKPDTPPSRMLPFWIDPVWSNFSNEQSNVIDTLNIQLPELLAPLAVVLTPSPIDKKMFLYLNKDEN